MGEALVRASPFCAPSPADPLRSGVGSVSACSRTDTAQEGSLDVRLHSLAACSAAAALVVSGVTACGDPSPQEQRDAYCAQLEEDSPTLTRIVDEKGAAAFVEALPTLQGLADEAPEDIRDDWQVFLNALEGLEKALDETGVDPTDVAGNKLPADLSEEERRRVRAAANVLTTPEVTSAAAGLEQHALDVCEVPIF